MTADVAARAVALSADDPRAMLPIEEVAAMLGVTAALLKRNHHADPDGYPATRVGTQWRMPTWWVRAKIACRTPVNPWPHEAEVALT